MQIDVAADELISAALAIPPDAGVCILDSSGVGHLGSRLLIVGFLPKRAFAFNDENADILETIEDAVHQSGSAAIFTLSYALGRKLLNIGKPESSLNEPLAYAAIFDVLAVHDYVLGQTRLCGKREQFDKIADLINTYKRSGSQPFDANATNLRSNFSQREYIAAVNAIKEEIRNGNTYQTNLTQQLTVSLDPQDSAQDIFLRLRKIHPAPFAAYIERGDSTVVSASPERFIRVEEGVISASPIKGTRRRSNDLAQDRLLADELLASEKDRAENTMIVDLLRNDLGRVCEFGSVNVEKLCELESHPTLYHLVSTITGKVRDRVGFAEIVKAVFPSGSITGAPKISTMRIIDRIERVSRGLSMGAIGILVPDGFEGLSPLLDINVAIRTMTISNGVATFNVGGGIVIDSDPMLEYEESLLKAHALLNALGARQLLK